MTMPDYPLPPEWVLRRLREGQVIPAHPLALTATHQLDERRQRALTRYYQAAGAGGVAVGVHTTQFSVRDAKHGLLKPVLQLAVETIGECDARTNRETVRIAGLCGTTGQAVKEADLARELRYHAGLLSLGALQDADDNQLIAHCEAVAREIPLVGFYLQPAAGGRLLEGMVSVGLQEGRGRGTRRRKGQSGRRCQARKSSTGSGRLMW
ncbi:MAG: hypothetical protein HUU13_06790 [Burkholderiaceae bacterium]|nr:hypothetical protein [Burkholderiaceae bacterium]